MNMAANSVARIATVSIESCVKHDRPFRGKDRVMNFEKINRSLSHLGNVGCKLTAAVHFSPSFCPIAGLWACKSGKNRPRWGRFSLVKRPKSDRLLGTLCITPCGL